MERTPGVWPPGVVPQAPAAELGRGGFVAEWVDEDDGTEHALAVEDVYTASEWSVGWCQCVDPERERPQKAKGRCQDCGGKRWHEVERSRGKGREPLPADWFAPVAKCSDVHQAPEQVVQLYVDALRTDVDAGGWGKCSRGACPCCGPRSRLRALNSGRASMMRLLEEQAAEVWLVTLTRRGHVTNEEEAHRFNRAARMLDAYLRWAGALGVLGVFEVVLQDDKGSRYPDTALKCCEDGEEGVCPLCETPGGGGNLPEGHLHAHLLVAVRGGGYVDWSWLQNLQGVRAMMGADYNVDVQLGDQRGGIDGVWGYVGGYVGRMKEPLQQPWLRSMFGKSANATWRSGALAGATAKKVDITTIEDRAARSVRTLIRRTWAVRSPKVRPRGTVDLVDVAHQANRSLRERELPDVPGLADHVRADLEVGEAREVWKRPEGRRVRRHRVHPKVIEFRQGRAELQRARVEGEVAHVVQLVHRHGI